MRAPLIVIIASCIPLAAQCAVVAYWNFNELSIASASNPGSGGAPSSIGATQGSGSLQLGAWSGTVDDFSGSDMNALSPDSPGQSLSLIAGGSTAGNGGHITMSFSLSGLMNPALSFATQGTATGFANNQLAWSINNIEFTDFGSSYAPSASYSLQSFDLSTIDALDGASSVWLRVTFDGATGATGNNRIDNLQITAIPEPAMVSLLAVGTILLLRRSRGHD